MINIRDWEIVKFLQVNGMSVLTLGDDAAAGKTPVHPYYGTHAVVDALKAKATWPEVKW